MVLVSELRRYSLAAISCGLVLAVAWPSDAPTSCFFLAAMVSSLYGGKGPGLMSVALSALAYDYFFLPPRFHLAIEPSSYVPVSYTHLSHNAVAASRFRAIDESTYSERCTPRP